MMDSLHKDTKTNTTPGLTTLIQTLAVWRRFILWSLVVSALISLLVAFLITPKFRSAASVLPAEKVDMFGSAEGISSLVKTFSPSKGLAALAGSNELDRYLAILKSAHVLADVIAHFDLVHVYGITSYPIEKTTKELLSNVDFSAEPEGNLTITVYDTDPGRAAEMANFFVDELNRINGELQVQNAKANRIFIENRYQKNLTDLTVDEDSLKAFQKHYGVMAMPDQVEASIKAGAELAAELALKEVQLGVEERTQSPDHPTVIARKIEIEELKRKISEMNSGGSTRPGEMKLIIPFRSIPDLGAEYLRRYREVETQYKILQFITPLLEQAKVEEQRQTPSVLILDRAFPAERKSTPKRLLIVLGGLFIGLLTSIAYVGASSRWKHEKEVNTLFYQATSRLFSALSSDLRSMKVWRPKSEINQDPH